MEKMKSKLVWFGMWSNITIAIATTIYVACMVVIPAFQHSGSWERIQAVWDRWQTLNAAMIALAASLIALYATKFNERESMRRKFLASIVLLPHALSELTDYLTKSAELYTQAGYCIEARAGDQPQLLTKELPTISDTYTVTFSQCIEYGDSQLAQFLGTVLTDLQVQQARMKNLKNALSVPHHTTHFSQQNIIADAFLIGHIKVLVDRIFPIARRSGPLKTSPLLRSEYETAFKLLSLDIRLGMVDELMAFTDRHLAARRNQLTTFSGLTSPDPIVKPRVEQ